MSFSNLQSKMLPTFVSNPERELDLGRAQKIEL